MEHREDHNEIPEFTLEDILAEFGSGSDLYRTEDLPAEENSPETAPAEAPAQQEAPAEPEPHAEPETSAVAELPGKPEGLRFTPGADPVDMDFPAEVLEEVFSSGGPLLPEEDQPPETQIIHFPHQPVSEEEGKPAAETTATEASSEENAPEEEPAEEPQETPEPQEAPKVSLEQIMNDTVSSVLEEQEDGILEERPPLREVLRHWWEKLTRPRSAAPIPQDTEIFFIHARLGTLHHFVNLAASVVGYFCQLHFPDITGNGCLRHRKTLCVELFCQLFLCLYVISADQIQDLCVSVDLHPSFPPTGHSSCFSGLQEN